MHLHLVHHFIYSVYDLSDRQYDNAPDVTDMGNWRTHQGNGFAVRHPFEATKDVSNPFITTLDLAKALGVTYMINCARACQHETRFFFTVQTAPATTGTLQEWYTKFTSIQSAPPMVGKKNITVGGEPAIYFEYTGETVGLSGFNKVFVLTQHQGVQYLITGSKYTAPYSLYDYPYAPAQPYASAFNQMLGTFTFTNYTVPTGTPPAFIPYVPPAPPPPAIRWTSGGDQ